MLWALLEFGGERVAIRAGRAAHDAALFFRALGRRPGSMGRHRSSDPRRRRGRRSKSATIRKNGSVGLG